MDVVLDGHVLEGLHRLGGIPQGQVPPLHRLELVARQVGVDPQLAHIVLKIVELGIDVAVPLFLGFVHVVQLIQDHLEGVVQGIEADLLLPFPGASFSLDAEIRIDKHQGLQGQVLQLQVPGGVVGSHMADGGHPVAGKPLVGIIVMKVGNPVGLKGPAAEFADVVAGRRPGQEGQVDGQPRLGDLPAHMHGDVVDTGDMPQGVEGLDLPADPHQLHHPLAAEQLHKPAVFPGIVAGFQLPRGEEGEIGAGIKGGGPPLLFQKNREGLQVQAGAGQARFLHRPLHRLGKNPRNQQLVKGRQPPLPGRGGKLLHGGAADFQQAGAGVEPVHKDSLGKPLLPAVSRQQGMHTPFGNAYPVQNLFLGQAGSQRFVKGCHLFIHGDHPPGGQSFFFYHTTPAAGRQPIRWPFPQKRFSRGRFLGHFTLKKGTFSCTIKPMSTLPVFWPAGK